MIDGSFFPDRTDRVTSHTGLQISPHQLSVPTHPLVSVITPTYNRAEYLSDAVQSVLNQTHSHLEYFIIDDGSTDDTAQILQPYLRDNRVRYYTQPHRGQSAARNTGLHLSRGEYVCFLDSDDIWEPDKLESELALFSRHPDVDIIYGDIRVIDPKGRDLGLRNMKRHSGIITEYLLDDNCVPFDSNMVRRRCFEEMGGLDATLPQSDDYELWLRFSTRYRFLYHARAVTRVRVMHNQLSGNKDARFCAVHTILTQFFERYPTAASRRTRNLAWSRFYVRRGLYNAAKRLYVNSLQDYFTAIAVCPSNPSAWRAVLRLLVRGK